MTTEHCIRHDEIDRLLTALGDRDRREVLEYLRGSPDGTATVAELAGVLRERDTGCEDRAKVVLHHSTLPKLAGAGVVDYDADARTVWYRGHPALESLLDDVTGPTR